MFAGLPSLTHEQQQKAVERIQELMAQGMSSGQAIALVADELRREGLSSETNSFITHHGISIMSRIRDPQIRAMHLMEG
mgnify:CR=1 FL=1